MKKLYIVLLSALVLAAAAVGIVSLADVDATESKTENRKLAALPEFSWSALLNGSYLGELETYYSDTFPGRELLLKANQKLNGFYHFGGQDNMLVLDYQGGAEHGGQALDPIPEQTPPEEEVQPVVNPDEVPVENVPEEPVVEEPVTEEPVTEEPEEEVDETENLDYTSAGSVIIVGDRAMDVPYATESIVVSYADAVGNLQTALGENVRVISLLTPNAAQFYSPKDMHSGVSDQKAMIELCYGAMMDSIVTVDAFSKLKAHKDEYIYFRTDHHWTQLGAYYAYTAFCESLGWEAVPLEDFETGQYTGFLGSMYGWTSQYPQSDVLKNHPDTLTYYLPVVETSAAYYADADLENSTAYPVSVVYQGISEDQSNKYLCFLGGDHPAATVETDVEGPVCMVLKESYGNAFVPFLTSHYSKIIVIDPREFNRDGKPTLNLADLAAQQGVDDLIVINYPFMVSSDSYVGYLNRLAGAE